MEGMRALERPPGSAGFAGGSGFREGHYFGKNHCLGASGQHDLQVVDNRLVGPGLSLQEGTSDHVGARFEWICGTAIQGITFDRNLVYDWNRAGIHLVQSTGFDMQLNRLELNKRGIDAYRTTEATGDPVEARKNRVQSPNSGDCDFRTNDPSAIDLGQATAWGRNMFLVRDPAVYARENSASTDYLPAQLNRWYLGGAVNTDDVEIGNRMSYDPGTNSDPRVVFTPLLATDPSFPGMPPSEQATEPDGIIPGDDRVLAGRAMPVNDDPSPSINMVPTETLLARVRPNPSLGAIAADFELAAEHQGLIRMTIYDVTGRKVADIPAATLQAGRHVVEWNGRSDRGQIVGSGIYFLTVEGRNFRRTSRIAILR
jgi:hypothetical protein